MARSSKADDPYNGIQHLMVRSPSIKHYDIWTDATFIVLLYETTLSSLIIPLLTL